MEYGPTDDAYNFIQQWSHTREDVDCVELLPKLDCHQTRAVRSRRQHSQTDHKIKVTSIPPQHTALHVKMHSRHWEILLGDACACVSQDLSSHANFDPIAMNSLSLIPFWIQAKRARQQVKMGRFSIHGIQTCNAPSNLPGPSEIWF